MRLRSTAARVRRPTGPCRDVPLPGLPAKDRQCFRGAGVVPPASRFESPRVKSRRSSERLIAAGPSPSASAPTVAPPSSGSPSSDRTSSPWRSALSQTRSSCHRGTRSGKADGTPGPRCRGKWIRNIRREGKSAVRPRLPLRRFRNLGRRRDPRVSLYRPVSAERCNTNGEKFSPILMLSRPAGPKSKHAGPAARALRASTSALRAGSGRGACRTTSQFLPPLV